MTRRPGESGLDGLAINEDDMVLDEDLDAQDVVVDVPAPVWPTMFMPAELSDACRSFTGAPNGCPLFNRFVTLPK